jgi:hypothetical protein
MRMDEGEEEQEGACGGGGAKVLGGRFFCFGCARQWQSLLRSSAEE